MNDYLKAASYSGIFLVCIGIHFLIMKFVLNSTTDFRMVYIFTGLVGVATLFLVAELNNYFHKYLGFLFIGIIALKLVGAKIFMDKSIDLDNSELKFALIILYLISLVLITIFTAKLLLRSEK